MAARAGKTKSVSFPSLYENGNAVSMIIEREKCGFLSKMDAAFS